MPDLCLINFLNERDKDKKASGMLMALYPWDALTIAKLSSRFTEWLKVVWYPSLTVFDEKTPSPTLSGKEQLPYVSEKNIPTCPMSRKLGQSSRHLQSL